MRCGAYLATFLLLSTLAAGQPVSSQQPDWVADIAQVRRHYIQGENALLNGNLPKAEKEFAQAFEEASKIHRKHPDVPELDEFLQGLQSTFEQLQRLHQMAILVPRPEKKEAPAVAEALPRVDLYAHAIEISPELRGKIERNLQHARYDLPVTLNEDVLRAIDFFLKNPNGRKLIKIGLERIGLYEDELRRILREEGVPTDLVYLAQLESNFYPGAVSSAAAVGPWQFVADTGMRYGLRLDWWVDERQDPFKSTRAAARYLKFLHNKVGDWYLVLASYNTGEGRIIPLANKGRDYWEISDRKLIAAETRKFVPLILAIAIISKNPAEFGFEVPRAEPLEFDTIEIKRAVSLKALSRRFGIDLDDLRDLNPELQQDLTPQYSRSYWLRLPAGTSRKVAARLPTMSARERMGN